jgi:two-component system, NarL family, response regulator LiaR
MRALSTSDQRTFNPRNGELTGRNVVGSFRPAYGSDRDRLMGGMSSTIRTTPSPTRVVIIDDQGIVRKGIRMFLESDSEINVVGEADSGESGIALVNQLQPHVVVLDVKLPGMDGIAVAAAIRRDAPATRILALSGAIEPSSVVGMIRAGATGYLAKDVRVSDLCRAVRAVAAGEVQLAPEAAASLTHEMRTPRSREPLTAREVDVLQLLVGGKSNKGIGISLHITEKTVKTHVSNIIAKLGVESRTQAALYAIKQGLVATSDRALAS